MKLFVGGDFVPHDAHARAVPDARAYVDSEAFHRADLRLVNLEAPMAAAGLPPQNPTGALSVRDTSCDALRLLRVQVVSLSNNHSLDYGIDGLRDTIRHLSAAGIAHVGAGLTEAEAHRPFRFGDRYGIWSYCHVDGVRLRNVPVAVGDTPGVARLTLEEVWRDLEAAPDVDHAVLFVHWGREHSILPPADVVRLARALLRHPKVRLIAGAHPHRLQGIRRTRQGVVAFSLGHLHVPGFVIAPPILMAGFDGDALPITRAFHPVARPTFKRWPFSARLSAGVVLDTRTHAIETVPLYQRDEGVCVREVGGPWRSLIVGGCGVAAWLTRLPAPLVSAVHAIGEGAGLLRMLYWIARSNGLVFASTSLRAWLRYVLRRALSGARTSRPAGGVRP